MRHLLLIATLGLAACNANVPGQKPTTGQPGPTAFEPAILLADHPAKFAMDLTATSFNFAYLVDLWVRVKVPAMQGRSILHLKFRNPAGEDFYTDDVPFSTESTDRVMMGPMGETDVLAALPLPGGYALDRRVPVLGTVFTRYSPQGDWEITAKVDGYPIQLSAPMHVTMVR